MDSGFCVEASTATMIETGHIAFGEVTVPN
jgi:hypothetical protein